MKLIFILMYILNAFDPYHIIPILCKLSVLFYPIFSVVRPLVTRALTIFFCSSAVFFVLLI